MIYIYGDSHSRAFDNLDLPHSLLHQTGITMYRIGRDNIIINYDKLIHNKESIVCIAYGEIDCRCHILNQILNYKRDENEVITTLVNNYFLTLKNNLIDYKAVIIVGIIPTTNRNKYERENDNFPFVGTDEERVRITKKMNLLIKDYCNNLGYIYFYPYKTYECMDGTLNFDLSDTTVHIKDNTNFLNEFKLLLYNNNLL